jgi:SAM-dependent methyltransferase
MKETIKRILFGNMSYNQIAWCQEKWLIWKSIRSYKYRGNQYFCPICAGNFQIFFPAGKTNQVLKNVIGAKYRKNAQCPGCSSIDRQRLIYLFLKNKILPSIKNQRIKCLHIAPELQIRKLLFNRNDIEYLSADIDPKAGQVKMDITAIDYPDNYFDAVICNHVLEHVLDDRKAIGEVFRVLGSGGWAIMQVPIDLKREDTFEDPNIKTLQDRRQFYGVQSHVRIYGLDYKDRLEECGFNVKQIKYARQLGKDMVDKLSLDPDEDINFCMKR